MTSSQLDRAATTENGFEILRAFVLGLALKPYPGGWGFVHAGDVPAAVLDTLVSDGLLELVDGNSRIEITELGRQALFAQTRDVIRTAMEWLRSHDLQKRTF